MDDPIATPKPQWRRSGFVRKLSYMVATPEAAGAAMCWSGDPAAVLPMVAAMGYRGVELQTRGPGAFDRDGFRKLAASAGLAITGVSTAPAVVQDGLYLTAPDPQVRAATVDRLRRVIDFAAECGTHATIGRMRGFAKWAPNRATGLGWFSDAVSALAEHAAGTGTRIVIEPQNRQVTDMLNDVASALEFCRRIGYDALWIEADVHHMLLEERSIPAALITAHRSGRLAHVQVSDTNRRAPGWGHLGWTDLFATLDALGYDEWIAVEAEQLPDSESVARQAIALINAMSRSAVDG
jgi:sugar phosphate isomerase/epimerase